MYTRLHFVDKTYQGTDTLQKTEIKFSKYILASECIKTLNYVWTLIPKVINLKFLGKKIGEDR